MTVMRCGQVGLRVLGGDTPAHLFLGDRLAFERVLVDTTARLIKRDDVFRMRVDERNDAANGDGTQYAPARLVDEANVGAPLNETNTIRHHQLAVETAA